jgi:hypothetical protein
VIYLIGTIGLAVGATAATLCVIVYHFSATWWRSEEGWHFMVFTGCLAVIFDWLLIRVLLADPGPASVAVGTTRAAVYWTVGLLLVWRLWLLARRQIWASWRREKRRDPDGRDG